MVVLMWRARKEREWFIKKILETLEEVHNDLEIVYFDIDKLSKCKTSNNLKEMIERDLSLIGYAFSEIDDGLETIKEVDTEFKDSILDRMEELESENIELKMKLRESNSKNIELETKLRELETKLIEFTSDYIEDIVLFNKRVTSAINQIALTEYLKTPGVVKKKNKSGEQSPRFRSDIPNESLVEDLNKGLTVRQLADKYGMSYQGIKNRLKKLNLI